MNHRYAAVGDGLRDESSRVLAQKFAQERDYGPREPGKEELRADVAYGMNDCVVIEEVKSGCGEKEVCNKVNGW